jgi:hypothetical protein
MRVSVELAVELTVELAVDDTKKPASGRQHSSLLFYRLSHPLDLE